MITWSDPGPNRSVAEGHRRTELGELPRAELERHYAAYRRRQARELVGLLPPEAVRPLYRRARGEPGRAGGETVHDPMALLVDFCERILPLPPFEVWLDDLSRSPEAHWAAVERSAEAPSPTTPATIEVRRFARDGRNWRARLRGFRDGDAWRGFIVFQPVPSRGTVHRTALIFREASVEDLRERFRGFDSASLSAFLRSALP